MLQYDELIAGKTYIIKTLLRANPGKPGDAEHRGYRKPLQIIEVPVYTPVGPPKSKHANIRWM
jgi:hypothetical protein